MSETPYNHHTMTEGEVAKKDRDLAPGGPDLEYDDSSIADSAEFVTGVSKVEAAQAVW
jgi:hypothetical protein